MPYTKNPYMPKVRMRAVSLVRQGWSIRKTARHFGVYASTVSRWAAKFGTMRRPDNRMGIPTESSRPHHHPNALAKNIVNKIIKIRKKNGRCAEVIHKEMLDLGHSVSLSSVKRTLKRQGLIKKRSPWKRWHFEQPRPLADRPGDLVQIDTIHLIAGELYVYTLIDVFSRWAKARVSKRINTHRSLLFVHSAQKEFPFSFSMLQSDHGSEFSTYFSENITASLRTGHRHSRVRKPSDNGHVERFNRTLQEECLEGLPMSLRVYKKALSEYLDYYNNKRLHLGLNLKTPQQVLRSY
jgi:transposase InsO family protein